METILLITIVTALAWALRPAPMRRNIRKADARVARLTSTLDTWENFK